MTIAPTPDFETNVMMAHLVEIAKKPVPPPPSEDSPSRHRESGSKRTTRATRQKRVKRILGATELPTQDYRGDIMNPKTHNPHLNTMMDWFILALKYETMVYQQEKPWQVMSDWTFRHKLNKFNQKATEEAIAAKNKPATARRHPVRLNPQPTFGSMKKLQQLTAGKQTPAKPIPLHRKDLRSTLIVRRHYNKLVENSAYKISKRVKSEAVNKCYDVLTHVKWSRFTKKDLIEFCKAITFNLPEILTVSTMYQFNVIIRDPQIVDYVDRVLKENKAS